MLIFFFLKKGIPFLMEFQHFLLAFPADQYWFCNSSAGIKLGLATPVWLLKGVNTSATPLSSFRQSFGRRIFFK